MHKVYLVTNLLNSVKYVGYTSKDINTRFEWHCTRKNCNKLYNAIKKYGRANFSVKELGVFGTKEGP